MRVHIAEFVEGRGRVVPMQGSQDSALQVAYVIENVARIYGYALLIVVWSILFVISICFPEYTLWPVDGIAFDDGGTGTEAKVEVPTVNRSTWSIFFGVVSPALIALRTMFATSTGSPHPLPGKERFTWKYAAQ